MLAVDSGVYESAAGVLDTAALAPRLGGKKVFLLTLQGSGRHAGWGGGGLHKFLVCGIGSMQLGALMHKNQNLMARHEGRPLCPGGGLFERDQTLD